jgi:hypothetical protein
VKGIQMSSKRYDNSESIQNASPIQQLDGLDDDLREQALKALAHPDLRDYALAHYKSAQEDRNKEMAIAQTLTPIERRRRKASQAIATQQLLPPDIHHVHSVLGLCALPYQMHVKRDEQGQRIFNETPVLGKDGKPKQNKSGEITHKREFVELHDYEVRYGRSSLKIEAGSLMDPKTGEWVKYGIPYGTKARLLQLHICTRALRNNSPIVEIEDSMSAFMASMGFDVTGGATGTIGMFKEQLNRLAACSMRIGLWDGESRAKTVSVNPIKSFEVWFPHNKDQRVLWPSQIELHQEFFDSLKKHALPIDIRSISAVSNSARQMDILIWLSYRVSNLQESYFLHWNAVKEQFCQSPIAPMTEFKRDFKKDLSSIESVFEKSLPLKVTEEGLVLLPCDPEFLFVPPKTIKKLK